VAAGVTAFSAARTQAALLFTVQAVGPDVVVTGSGTANTSDLTVAGLFAGYTRVIDPSAATINVGPYGFFQDTTYDGLTGPSTFGTGGQIGSFVGTGDCFGFNSADITPSFLVLELPMDYVSGAQLNGTATYTNSTFATMGVTPGTYVYSFGSGLNADTLTIDIGGVPVPEPASLGALAVGGTALIRRRRGR
jgi:hypothetical protein